MHQRHRLQQSQIRLLTQFRSPEAEAVRKYRRHAPVPQLLHHNFQDRLNQLPRSHFLHPGLQSRAAFFGGEVLGIPGFAGEEVGDEDEIVAEELGEVVGAAEGVGVVAADVL